MNRKANILFVLLLGLMLMQGCSDPGNEAPEVLQGRGIYRSSGTDGQEEYLEILVGGAVQKYITRDGDTEHAAIPDFLQPGDEISFRYWVESDTGRFVLIEIQAP
jgi:hypothetical protein